MSLALSAAVPVPLGDSGLVVGPIGWGMWRFAGTERPRARLLVETALEIGCTLFDTADVYGHDADGFGAAEQLLGAVLREVPSLRERMVLATKAGVRPPVPYDSSAEYLQRCCEDSLRRLGVERIDLFQIHRPDLLAHPAEVARALERLRGAGKIRAAGVSNYSAGQTETLTTHLAFPLASLQPELSALAIEALSDGVLDLALRRGLGVLAWSPLAGGRLGTTASAAAARERRVLAALDAVARRTERLRAAVACAWVMAHPARPVPLLGTQSPARIREAAQAFEVSMTRAEWYDILAAARGEPLP
ncbi:MAG: aldo/keto reductase [Gammaproteobacteria bacterium]|nr:aldo/keto reductase [Gammaproteobacteria bacterium]